jgi:hypothetical protein
MPSEAKSCRVGRPRGDRGMSLDFVSEEPIVTLVPGIDQLHPGLSSTFLFKIMISPQSTSAHLEFKERSDGYFQIPKQECEYICAIGTF